jgi:shikimate kinase/3-dehydroquinate synthase
MKRTPLPTPPLPAGRPNLVVTGFMGTGKTEAGRAAAGMLGLPFLDLDQAIASRTDRAIADLFATGGEGAFRAEERRTVLEASRLSRAVVATGGGAVLDRASFAALAATGMVTVLRCEPEELRSRLRSGAERPLLDEPGRVTALLEERAPAYADAGAPLDTTGRSVEETAAAMATRYPAPAGPLPLIVGDTDVRIGRGALEELPGRLTEAFPRATMAVILADPNAGATSRRAVELAAAAGLEPHRLDLPSGEATKTTRVIEGVWRGLLDLRLTRADPVIAVGGGATLDAAGFAAATFLRGVPTVLVPTTLLAMVDACLGGKVAVNFGGAKNAVGAFHPPRLVAADPVTLEGAPADVLRTGKAEVVKAGVLASPLLLDTLAADPPLDWVVEQALRIKAAYVLVDPHDHGVRRALNLGHTFAHAIESASGYAVAHGEAVAAGLIAAAHLGEQIGITPGGTRHRLAGVLDALALPTRPPASVDRGALARAMLADKKRRGPGVAFVIPTGDGADLVEDVDVDAALDALLGETA